MNVLILNSSPRKEGDSNVLCRRFADGAAEAGIIYGTGAWDKGDVYKHPAYEQAYQMGKVV